MSGPIRVAVLDDYDVIVKGTTELLRPFDDLVEVVETSTGSGIHKDVDVALLDCFGRAEAHQGIVGIVSGHPRVGRVAVYTWNLASELVEEALAQGASSYLSKAMPGSELAKALVATHDGDRVVSGPDGVQSPRPSDPRSWPGRDYGLTEREAEVLALLTQGKPPRDVAEALYLSINSVKTHLRNLYRKIHVSDRTQAALWGIDHGFRPDREARTEWAR